MRAYSSVFAALALAACAETKAPPPMVKDRACDVLDPYPGPVSAISPPDARIWAAGVNAALGRLCKEAAR
jgi:hypothetical protein